MITLKDIAEEAGVSITTVSNVVHNRTSRVSPEQEEKIWEIIERRHYVPSMTARTLANANSSIIGVITRLALQNTGSTMSDPFLSTFIEGIERRTREEGCFLMIRSVEDPQALESLSRSWRLSGVILTGMFQDEFIEYTRNLSIPFVLIDSYVDLPNVCRICLEDEKGAYIATKHLLENGHRVIAFASPSIRPGGVVEKRFQGYCRALDEYGISFDPSLVFAQENTVEEGCKLGYVLSEKKEITGIVASSDVLAAGIMAGLREKGVSVPQDKSIVGFDDNYLCRLTNPHLTTIHQDAGRKGVLATEMILAQMRNETVGKRSIILPVSLVERESVRNLNE
ncbi:MAG: LacI family DNA-binding transcriptional regulator [Oscillospiraceae bacterium]|nr:LacI family DNA-binding transcriptional regulator [Oscillospiraceae bacterium]